MSTFRRSFRKVLHPFGKEHDSNQQTKDDGLANTTTTSVEIRPKKPRRHTTGSTKETQEDILIAKHFNAEMQQNGGKVINELGQEIDPNSTLGRKQLIGMLKQRYGQDIENYRSSIPSGEKERMKRERQMERDRRHEQRMKHGLRDDDVEHRYIKTATVVTNGNGHVRRHSGGSAASGTSDGSDGSTFTASPPVRRTIIKSSTTVHNSSRYHSSDDEQNLDYKNRTPIKQHETTPRKSSTKEVVFLQLRDEMRRVNLPSSISSIDAIKVLFVNAFPGKISMPDFENKEKSIYIKDMETGVYFQLDDVGDVLNRSFLKIHEKHAQHDQQSKNISDLSQQQQQQNMDHHSFSETECHNLEKYHSSNKQKTLYAESLQDYDLSSPRLQRTNSGSSLRSDNVFNRPTYLQNSSTSSYSYISEDGSTRVQPSNEVAPLAPLPTATAITTTTHVASPLSPRKKLNSRERSMSDSSSVQDQLDDLTELLKTALHEDHKQQDDLFHTEYGDAKNPGKLNQNFIEDLQIKMDSSAKKNQCLPKHFQPTVIVKAQQEAHHRSTPPERNGHLPEQRKSSNESSGSGSKEETNILKPSSSVRVTVRSTTSKQSDEIKPSSVMNTQHKSPRVSEDFFKPPNKQSYVEYKGVTSTNETTVNQTKPHATAQVAGHALESNVLDFDMSELDDLINYNPYPQQKKTTTKQSKDTKEVASDLLDQLQDLENEMKLNLSSVGDSVENSRSSSSSSATSKSSGMYASVNKQVKFSNVEELSSTQQAIQNVRQHATTVSYTSPHADAEAELQKLRAMSLNSTNSNSNHSPATARQKSNTKTKTVEQHMTMTSPVRDETDSVFTFTRTSTSSSQNSSTRTKPTRQVCERPSVATPDFIELEVTANRVRESLQDLRRDLSALRKMHVDNTRHFKNDVQKKLLEFRKKANKVDDLLQNKIDRNSNNIFANDHPVREQRHRLTGDQNEYSKKVSSTEYRLQTLEGAMENVRLDVVQKKRVEQPDKLFEFEEEIVNITRGLTDVRNKFLGISDMLQRVTKLETEIIQKEEGFVKEEPEKLDLLINRCKTLSGTLQTLQKLAKMQHDVANRKTQNTSIPDYQEIDDINHNTQRGVRFQR